MQIIYTTDDLCLISRSVIPDSTSSSRLVGCFLLMLYSSAEGSL